MKKHLSVSVSTKRKRILTKLCYSGFLFLFIFAFFVAGAESVFADVGTSPNFNPLSVNSFPDLIQIILEDIVVPIGGIVATLAIVYSGFLFVTAQGNPEKLSQARSAFTWAVIGGLIILGAWAIAQAIEATMDQITAMAYFF